MTTYNRLGGYWRRIVPPALHIPHEEERQQVVLLTALSAALLLAALIVIPIWLSFDHDFAARYLIGFGALGALGSAYAFARTRFYRASASILVMMLIFIVASVIMTTPATVYEDMLVMNFLIVAILLSSLLLPVRATLVVFAICLVGTILFLLVKQATFPLTYPFLVFLSIMAALFVVDTSIRRRYLRQMRQSTIRYRSLFQQTHDGVFVLSLDGRILEANSRAAEMLGYSMDEIQNLPLSAWSAEIPQSAKMQERIMAGEHIPVFERLVRKKDGSIIPVEISVELVRDPEGIPSHVQSVARDISQRKRMEQALRESEERYRSIVSAMAEGVVLQDRSGAVQTYNAAAERILGLAVNQMIRPAASDTAWDAIHEDGSPFPVEAHPARKTLATGLPQRDVIMGVSKPDDGLTWISMNSQPIIQPDDSQPYAVVTSFSDITERKQAEERLRQSEERFSKAFRNSPVPMMISTTDPQSPRCIEANQAYQELVGYNWDELAGKNLVDMGIGIPGETTEALLAGDYKTQEAQIKNRAGGNRDVIISVERVVIDGQECDIKLFLDITERKKIQEQTFALAVEKERVEIVTHFIQTASHEFRTPLSVINSCFYMIANVTSEDRRQRYVDQAGEQIMLLSRLLDMTLSMTKLDSGIPFNYQPLEINHLVYQIIDAVQTPMADKMLTSRFIPAIAVPLVKADSRWLSEALRHIMDNAIRFTPAEGSITLTTRVDGKQVIIEIRDNGVGISEKSLPHIFERFWRQDEAHTTPGFGLGLPIALKIVEQHGGTIEAESTVGAGSTFRVALPLNFNPK